MYLYPDPTYPRTSLEKWFKQVHSITNALLFIMLLITLVDFYVRVENTFVNYWGGGNIAMATDMASILENCTFDWELDITTTTVDVHIGYESALIVSVITAAFIVGICVLTFILLILDTVMKTLFLMNIRYVRFRAIKFPLQTVTVTSALVLSIGVIGAISASEGSLRFMDRYVQKCSSEFNTKFGFGSVNATGDNATGDNAFIEAELDSATVFGTNLYLILAAVSFNLLGYLAAVVAYIIVNRSKAEGRLLAARIPYFKPGVVCVPDKILLREYGVQRKRKLRSLEQNPFEAGAFNPVLSGDLIVDDGDNDLTMAALLYDWTRDPKVDQSLLIMTEKDITDRDEFTDAEKEKLIAKRKELVLYVRQRQADAIREIRRQDKEKRSNQAAADIRRRMNTDGNLPELFQPNATAPLRPPSGGDVESPDSLGNSVQNPAGEPWVADEELDPVDPQREVAQELSGGDNANSNEEGSHSRNSPRSEQESVTPEPMDMEEENANVVTTEDEEEEGEEYSLRREKKKSKKNKKSKKSHHKPKEEDHLNEDIPELDNDDDDEPYYVYYDEEGNLLGEGSEFDALGEGVDTLEQAMQDHREERRDKKEKKKAKKEKKDKKQKRREDEVDGAPTTRLFAPPVDEDDEVPTPPPPTTGFNRLDEEDAVPAPPPATGLMQSPPPRQVRSSPNYEASIPVAFTP